ncbi:50S ribosomal protein L24 [Armatimonadota bacterium]|nr:50S ribosomal protein L24 [Armatimonadota bacterium]
MTYKKPGLPDKPVKLKVKAGDTVKIITGKDKGHTGIVLTAIPKENKVVVQGLNMMIKHEKDRQARKANSTGANTVIKGGRIEKEAPLNASKVMLVCTACGRPTRVGYAYREGTEKLSRRKYRVCRHSDCGKAIDSPQATV